MDNLPTRESIVSAFVKDLTNSLALFSGGQAPTKPIMFFALTGATLTWTADEDYFFVGFTVSGSGNSWFFGVDTTNPASIATTTIYNGTKFAGGPTLGGTVGTNFGSQNMKIPVGKGTKLSLVNGTSGSVAFIAFLIPQ